MKLCVGILCCFQQSFQLRCFPTNTLLFPTLSNQILRTDSSRTRTIIYHSNKFIKCLFILFHATKLFPTSLFSNKYFVISNSFQPNTPHRLIKNYFLSFNSVHQMFIHSFCAYWLIPSLVPQSNSRRNERRTTSQRLAQSWRQEEG